MKLKPRKNGTPPQSKGVRAITDHLKKISVDNRADELALKRILVPKKRDSGPDGQVTITVKGKLQKDGLIEDLSDEDEKERKFKAMRRLYNRHLPKLQCDNCAFSQQCTQFKAGFECAFLPFLHAHSVRNEKDLLFYMKELAGQNVRRVQLALMMETMTGGAPTLETSESLDSAFRQMLDLKKHMDETKSEATLETSDTSIVGKLFGGLGELLRRTKEAQQKPLDVSLPAGHSDMNETKQLSHVNEELIRDLSVGLSTSGSNE